MSEAQQTVQHTKHFAHPANWAGFVLVGADVRLSNKVALMGQALTELLKTPDKCRDALRVTLHLVEKSLQRIHRGYRNAMYTTQRSIENKVGPVGGWKELLISVGFRFEPAANNIPASVFFPQSDPGERLTQCSASLQALLGLTTPSLLAISKLLASSEASTDDITAVLRNATVQLGLRDLESESVDIPVPVKLWRLPGCHELLASLGFDLMEVGRNEVTLRTGKLANKRNIQFALQALLALFGKSRSVPECYILSIHPEERFINWPVSVRNFRFAHQFVAGIVEFRRESDIRRGRRGARTGRSGRQSAQRRLESIGTIGSVDRWRWRRRRRIWQRQRSRPSRNGQPSNLFQFGVPPDAAVGQRQIGVQQLRPQRLPG